MLRRSQQIVGDPEGVSLSRFAALVRPQVVVSALLLVGALLFSLSPSGPQRPGPPTVELSAGIEVPIVEREVRLLVIDPDGLERPLFARLSFADSPFARLEAVLTALRVELVAAGVWPEAGSVPTLFRGVVDVRTFVVLDFGDGFDGMSVVEERQLIGSLEATLRAEGIDEVRYLRHGRAEEAPFGHLAQRTTL